MQVFADKKKVVLSLVGVMALIAVPQTCSASDETVTGKMSTANTQDIDNTLRKEGKCHKMLDGLQIAFDMDNKLKGKGSFTVFAADDKAWAKINQADQDTLFNNKKKLAQVFAYQVIDNAKLTSDGLAAMHSVKSSEGHEIKLSLKDKENAKDGEKDLYVDKAFTWTRGPYEVLGSAGTQNVRANRDFDSHHEVVRWIKQSINQTREKLPKWE